MVSSIRIMSYFSIFSTRPMKWLYFISLCLLLLIYGHQHIAGNKSNGPIHRKDSCKKGSTCNAPIRSTPKLMILKPTKQKKRKPTRAPYLVHILPNMKYSNEKITTSKLNKAKKVLIISYFNTSPLHVADILKNHSDIFYYDEPLYPFDSTSLKDGEEPISRRIIYDATAYLSDLFECNILESKMGYSDQIIKKIAPVAYSSCKLIQSNVSECIEATCKSKPTVVAKTIRIYLQDVQEFLAQNKDIVKVIILQRDPRVNLHLHNKKARPGWVSGTDMFFQGRSLCSRMLHDVQTAKRLEGSGYKNFYRIVLFEHFMKNPETVMSGLLSFLGMTTDLNGVKKLLRASNVYKQLRKAKLNKWESIPDDDAGMSIDKACTFFYRNSLYNPMQQALGFVQRYNLCQYCE
ncbi:uncharacterized protein LOC118188629 isoform X2 [Stegodyphus dumicola]|nr:uncharacterized protein LOC118188629 isoform X2 [Stegodyphus dumicola]